MKLETARLILRDAVMADLDNLHRLLSDQANMYYLDDVATRTLGESEANLRHAMLNDDGHYFCIERKEDRAYIGQVGYTITDVTPCGKIVHMGYFILPEQQGRGYTTEAVGRAVRYAFEEDGCVRITTGCYADNKASERVMIKSGFLREGLHKKAQYHDGIMKDRLSYAINKDDYAAR
ncbi:MAG: GNAT family N-acetyltransferase [Oscillospiraceae bacterium]|jgi:ribosomal-protein-alanine N-acetyltransferase|nr:GNAT family N-acetyltransferase [Oscillospiraceae bacterium]